MKSEFIDSEPVAKARSSRGATSLITIIVLALVLGAGGFVGGMQYQKGKAGSSTLAAGAQNGQATMGQFGGRGAMNGGFGSVTAVSASSISVKDQRQNTTNTYSISSSTTISDNGTAKSASDIAVGDTVMVRTSSSTSSAATAITLNPTMGGGPGSADDSGASSDSTST